MSKYLTTCLSINNEKGVSILEFALILPLFVILISGAIDISSRVNSKNHVNAAARQAAIAASSFTFESRISCPLAADGLQTFDLGICPEIPRIEVITPEMEETITMNEVIRITSCNYLKERGFSAANWNISSQIGYRDLEGVLFPIVRVQLTEQAADCLVCYRRFGEMVSLDSVQTQGLEGCPNS